MITSLDTPYLDVGEVGQLLKETKPVNLHHGDCLEVLRTLPDNSIDSLVTDPPAGIGFMGKEWDHHKGGRKAWCAWMEGVMRECLRVMKPGAHGLVWALPRTSHWAATALEDASFEIRDCVYHLFGSGFPKSLDVSKAIDKAAGAKRDVGPIDPSRAGRLVNQSGEYSTDAGWSAGNRKITNDPPSTDAAKQWQGFGTALKPAVECWWLVRKPCSEKTVAANVLKWGTGALNIDGSRVGTETTRTNMKDMTAYHGNNFGSPEAAGKVKSIGYKENPPGRFPSHLLLSHTLFCEQVGVKKVMGQNGGGMNRDGQGANNAYSKHQGHEKLKTVGFASDDGTETVEAWECTDDCPVTMLDEQSGRLRARGNKTAKDHGSNYQASSYKFGGQESGNPGDSGGASRFFYCAKVSSSERNAGLEGMPDRGMPPDGPLAWGVHNQTGKPNKPPAPAKNHHPTVKPQKLMRYLARLVTPPGGVVLDPFMGSGSTGLAAKSEGFGFVGIERELEYHAIASKRMEAHA